MARITPLWTSPEISVHRFDHPVEHEDQPYEEVSSAYMASFVETGTFDLEIAENRWRVNPGDVMLSHPKMRFRAGFQGKGFNDTCLSLTYLAANDDGFDRTLSWSKKGQPILKASNRLHYLHWGLRKAVETGSPMFVEYCATEIFEEAPRLDRALVFSDRKFSWYAERVHHIREHIGAAFAEDFSVSDLARSVGISMFHFTRIFAELIGMPPHRYLLKVRLEAARKMLLQGHSVTETCYACGFGNLSHFSRSFSRRYGHAPSRLTS